MIDIVIPVYNDPSGTEQTIKSLISSVDQNRASIYVVDNNSTYENLTQIQSTIRKYDNTYMISENKVQSSYAARNRGIKHTGNNILAFLDADVTVNNKWLDTATNVMDKRNLDYLGCDVKITLSENTLIGRYNAHTGFPVRQYLDRHRYAPTCALFVRREVFEDVGLFDPRLVSGGDMEFGNRVDAAGYEMGYCADAVVRHPVRSSVRSLYGKNVRVGRGHCQLQRYYPERYGEPPVPPRHEPIDTGAADPSLDDRLTFGALSTAMTAARASGYARELLSPTDTGATVSGPPSL